ncbi:MULTISPECIES: patatin-like phospholipase family protein [unclassified Pseudodesulfovibrio]|uniref:patatin-like phospholipase family protein n=1 Tax=unclassified Pseudodesulfovibrio TaxID=2661612 RepID=UPI000FEBD8F3|nr:MULTISPECIES: patatin-like phospholipase family protein [unclassified Pseudodesulfovibrio]MCJ2164283.1 patatin-like phospholipase family protein [Pseudodesulfovibrio sp. S3-i]RWU05095.1 serine protease [Pseudodesulfovibrio sp. S3]
MKKRKTVSLVLGSGGARGLAHIGVIHWLEENGYAIKSISGSSMGALVGGIHAIGKLDEFEKWVRAVTRSDMLKLLDLSMGMDGLFKGGKIINTLKSLVGDSRIEDLPIDFTAVATNISRAKEVWFDEGPMFDAIRASISLPLFFTPYKHKGEDLVDGGILNPVPIAPTFRDQTDVTIAVNVCGAPGEGLEDSLDAGPEEKSALTEAISDFLGKVRSSIPRGTANIGAYDIVAQSFETMQGTIARQKIAAYPPDYVLEIPKNLCKILEFHKAAPLIQYGYDKAAGVLPSVFMGK